MMEDEEDEDLRLRQEPGDLAAYTVVSGLIAGNRIGLAIGELPQGLDIAQTAETYFPYRGEGFQNLPNIGVFYDTVVVQP